MTELIRQVFAIFYVFNNVEKIRYHCQIIFLKGLIMKK